MHVLESSSSPQKQELDGNAIHRIGYYRLSTKNVNET
jgi:hypothetical protein